MKLYEWQAGALDAFRDNNYRGLVIAGTGSGKTYMAIEAIKELKQRTLIVVPTISLLQQWKKELLKNGIREDDLGLYYGEVKLWNKVTIAVVNSVANIVGLDKKFNFIVLDEVHRFGKNVEEEEGTWVNILLNNQFKYSLGLTATLERNDGGHTILEKKVGKILYEYSVGDALKDNVVSPMRIKCVGLDLSDDECAELDKLDSDISDLMSTFSNDLSKAIYAVKKGNRQAGKLLRLINKRKKFYHNHERKIRAAKETILSYREKKVMVFGSYIDSIDRLYKLLKENNIQPFVYYSGNKKSLFSFTNEDKRQIINDFKQADSGVLLSVKALDEGIDAPDVSIGVLLGMDKTSRQAIQRMGRLIRHREGKTAIMYLFYFRGTSDVLNMNSFVQNFEDIAKVEYC